MKLSKVELHEYVKTGDSELHSRVIDASDSLAIEADMVARVVWFHTSGKSRRWTPFENVRYADEGVTLLHAEDLAEVAPLVVSLQRDSVTCPKCSKPFLGPKSLEGHLAHCGKQRGKLGGGTGK